MGIDKHAQTIVKKLICSVTEMTRKSICGGSTSLEPFTSQPAVEELETRLGLIHRDHVATTIETHEGEVAMGLNLADLLARVLIVDNDQILQLSGGIFSLSGPLQGFSPGLVAQPVANKIGITGIDQDRDLLQESRNEAVVGLHPVTVEEEVAVDVKVARVVAVDLSTNSLDDFGLVQVVADVAHSRVAKVRAILALTTDIVDVLPSALVRGKEGVVTVDGGRDTNPSALGTVARLNHRLAARKSVVHGLAGALVQDSWVTAVTAGHGTVVLVLGVSVGETVANENGLQVDVALLVRQDLRSEDGDIVTSIRFTGNVEVLLGILGELFEEEGKQGIDVLASSDRVADSRVTVGVTDIDRLVKEDHGRVGVPSVVIVDRLDLLVDAARAKLHEKTGEGRAPRATVQPQNNGVVLGVIARLEEP